VAARPPPIGLYSRLLGSLAPIGRRRDGRLAWRNPLDGPPALPQQRALTAVVS
jgi:hypothetical protein